MQPGVTEINSGAGSALVAGVSACRPSLSSCASTRRGPGWMEGNITSARRAASAWAESPLQLGVLVPVSPQGWARPSACPNSCVATDWMSSASALPLVAQLNSRAFK